MGNVREFKQEIESMLFRIYSSIGMDKPSNHDEILDFIAIDVSESAGPLNWNSCDVSIAFRRWIEKQSEIVGHFCPEPTYFKVVSCGWDGESQRQEVQIHGGENANIFLIKTKKGFIVNVYGQNDLVKSLNIWEDDIKTDDEEYIPDMADVENFIDDWGQTTDEVCTELGYDEESSDDLLMIDYFWYLPNQKWIPKSSILYTEEDEQMVNYLKSNQNNFK